MVNHNLSHCLCCPDCHGSLSFDTEGILCQRCHTQYDYVAGKPRLIPLRFREDLEQAYQQRLHGGIATHALTNKISRHAPQIGKAIRAFAHAVRPPDPWGHYGRARFIAQLFPNGTVLVVDVGCGAHKMTANCFGFDAHPSPAVDVLATSEMLPLATGCADGVVSCSLLEHVPDPDKVLDEMVRVLKPGGYIYLEMPFLQGYHPSPYDGQRFTCQGLERRLAMRGIQVLETGMCSGPGSAVSYLVRNWLAVMCSFRSSLLFELVSMFWGWVIFPLKYLDWLVKSDPRAVNLAFGIYAWGQKGREQ